MRRLLVAVGIAVALLQTASVAQEASYLPNRPGSFKFAAIGDNGTGDQPEYDVPHEMEQWHRRFAFDMVIMLGDNLYLHMGDEQMLVRGWPIACAADLVIAVAMTRAIFGRSTIVTVALLMAVTSDVIGLAVISRDRFATDLHPIALVLIAVAVAMAVIFKRRGVTSSWLYVFAAGSLSWLGCYWSGVQPVLALLPIIPFFCHSPRQLTSFADEPVEHQSPSHFEATFELPVQVIVLLFAFVNIGMGLHGFGTGTWAVMVASVVGRPVGIVAAMGLTTISGLRLPEGMGWKEIVVTAFATSPTLVFGVLFAVSAFPVGPLLAETKLGAVASMVGVLPAFGAARLLSVGRFRTVRDWSAANRRGTHGIPARQRNGASSMRERPSHGVGRSAR